MRRQGRRWDPWRELTQLQQEVNRLFNQNWRGGPRRPEHPGVNVWQDAEGVLLVSELPGINPDELDITINGDTVTIRGRRQDCAPGEGENYIRRERVACEFSRTVQLPFEVDAERAEANYERGMLTLKLRRPEQHQPRKIVIRRG